MSADISNTSDTIRPGLSAIGSRQQKAEGHISAMSCGVWRVNKSIDNGPTRDMRINDAQLSDSRSVRATISNLRPSGSHSSERIEDSTRLAACLSLVNEIRRSTAEIVRPQISKAQGDEARSAMESGVFRQPVVRSSGAAPTGRVAPSFGLLDPISTSRRER